MPEPSVTLPLLRLRMSQWKPLPMFSGSGVSVTGWLQIKIRPLWIVPSRFVFAVISTTGIL